MKRVAILGSTGSIGTQTLDVISQHPDKLEVCALAAKSQESLLIEQAERHHVRHLALYDEASQPSSIPRGIEALVDLVTLPEVDIVVISLTGMIGLIPTMAAIKAGKKIAPANKEVLVAAGEIVMPLAKEHGVEILPIDSEHSAIFQCLQGCQTDQVESITLTASGGPFRGRKRADLRHVTVDEALRHPSWSMGGKITIDCATLVNKGLEAIEAQWLFGIDIDQVNVVVHPGSIIHSFVRFKDNSTLCQLGWPDMRLPIQYALLYPERPSNNLRAWSPLDTPNLIFEVLDEDTFRGVSIAKHCARIGGTLPCTFNAANEVAVEAFLKSKINFLDITDFVEEVVSHSEVWPANLDNILEADRIARLALHQKIESRDLLRC